MTDLRIPGEEQALLDKARASLETAATKSSSYTEETRASYASQLLDLRDQIAEARLEDVPALMQQMERISGVAARRSEVKETPVDPRCPYFAHLRLQEGDRTRDVMIGRGTHIDGKGGVRIVDWRHAPVSQLYYRYPEGASYEETFGEREVEGEILVRRTVTVRDGELVRIHAPQGVFVKRRGEWASFDAASSSLAGGQGTAARAERGVLGTGGDGEQRLDRHLPEIAALLDPRQFELISAPDAGVVVIQGGAGSGKTTIGLHRIAYLAYRAPERFRAQRILVVTYGPGLAAYISEVLPSLGVEGVKVVTFQAWAEKRRKLAFPWVKARYEDDTPAQASKLKKHPALLRLLAARARAHLAAPRARRTARAALQLWAEVLTDLPALEAAMAAFGDGAMTRAELAVAHRYVTERCTALVEERETDDSPTSDDDEPGRRDDGADVDVDERRLDEDDDRSHGVDGEHIDAEVLKVDREDDALMLRAHQLLAGPLKKGRDVLAYDHLFVDEAQDLSPVELAVLLEATSAAKSVTLAGDTAQRLYMDNGFRDWREVLGDLGLESANIEPLRIAYRSTREVVAFSREVLGPLAEPDPPAAPRSGAPVEAHSFPDAGAAVAFLGEALRRLFQHEPRASVGVLARFPEQADAYFDGLRRAEVPNLRRVHHQDFVFKAGVDVTEVRQVKGLEFDYVILVDVNRTVYPVDDASRHLLHIGATRAAHQLWVVVTSLPSPLLPESLGV